MSEFKTLYGKPKSFIKEKIQKLFLIILLKLFPKKFELYKEKIKKIMNIIRHKTNYGLMVLFLRFKYPKYI